MTIQIQKLTLIKHHCLIHRSRLTFPIIPIMFILLKGSTTGSQTALGFLISLVYFNLKFLRLSLTFMTLTIWKISGQFYRMFLN